MKGERGNMPYNSRTADKFVVRLPDGLRERIADVARTHHRSMNSEIIARLARSLDEESTERADSDALSDSGAAPESKTRTVSWCPNENEPVCHEKFGIGVIGRMFVQDGKLYAEIHFEGSTDIFPLAAGGPISPYTIKVAIQE